MIARMTKNRRLLKKFLKILTSSWIFLALRKLKICSMTNTLKMKVNFLNKVYVSGVNILGFKVSLIVLIASNREHSAAGDPCAGVHVIARQ